jgi:hypothetical protein
LQVVGLCGRIWHTVFRFVEQIVEQIVRV